MADASRPEPRSIPPIRAMFECINGHRLERMVYQEHGVLLPDHDACSICGWGLHLISVRRVEQMR